MTLKLLKSRKEVMSGWKLPTQENGFLSLGEKSGSNIMFFHSIDLHIRTWAWKELMKHLYSCESFFGWKVICQALMRRTMQPWLINLSIYRDCETVAACAPCQWAASSLLSNFYWCLTMLAAVQSLTLTLKIGLGRGGWGVNQSTNHLAV